MIKQCQICQQEFETRDSRTIVCFNNECRKEWNRIQYKNKTKTCICQKCGKEYQATEKQSKELCPECIKEKPHILKEFQQNIVCRQCGKILGTVTKKITRKILENNPAYTCDECKKKNNLEASLKMKLNNPARDKKELTWEEYCQTEKEKEQEKQQKEIRKEQYRKETSERMKKDNPMKNPNSKAKMQETMKKRLASGELKYPRGKERKSFKGTRSLQNYIRICLIDWKKANFERTDYTCEVCGARRGYLQVHHKEPFIEIFERFLKELGLNGQEIEYMSEDYLKLEKAIVDYHNSHDIGLVVCESCHDKVDPKFHKRHILDNKENENEN